MRKRIVSGAVMLLCMVMLTACGMGKRWVFSLNGEKLYDKDIDAFGFVYAKDHNIVDDGQLDDVYEDGDTYSEHYKKEFEDAILSNVLLSKEAESTGIKLSGEQVKMCKQKAETLVAAYGSGRLKEAQLDEKDIQHVYELQKLAQLYVEQKTGGKSGDAEQGDAKEPEHYITVYQVMFPTVEFDEDGMLKSEKDGEVVAVADGEKAEQKIRAEEFADSVSGRTSMEDVLKEYSSYASGVQKSLKYEDLDNAYRKAVDELSEGQTSEVFEGRYGYYVIRLIQKDAKEHAEQIADYEEQIETQNARKDIMNDLYDSYVGSDKNYRNDKRWDAISVSDYLQ